MDDRDASVITYFHNMSHAHCICVDVSIVPAHVLMTDLLSSTVKILQGRELTGVQRFSSINPVSNYERMRLHRRILGHLSAVYCIAFDRTGLRIFTVSWNFIPYPPNPKTTPCLKCCGIHFGIHFGSFMATTKYKFYLFTKFYLFL